MARAVAIAEEQLAAEAHDPDAIACDHPLASTAPHSLRRRIGRQRPPRWGLAARDDQPARAGE
jgi:hypothetical protein